VDDIGGEGLFILAAVVIAFINWVSNTLKQKAAQREIERRQARGDVPEEPAQESSEGWPEPDVSKQGGAADGNREIRDFFSALAGGQPAQQQPQPQAPPEPVAATRPTPTSPPTAQSSWAAPKIKKPTLSASERAALQRLKGGQLQVAGARSKQRSRHSIIEQLRRPGGARDAVVFSEILSKPKGLAER
jgi:hypothetical protein